MMRSEMESIKSKAFAQTCNKLSQFLKEKRSLGLADFAFHNSSPSNSLPHINGPGKEICGSNNTIMNLFTNKMEKEGNFSTGENLKSLDLFPLMSSSSAVSPDELTKSTTDYKELVATKEEPKTKTANMTIFYGGRVLVFDDLPEDKANEIMSLANEAHVEPHIQTIIPTQFQTNNNVTTDHSTHTSILLDQANSSDLLPIARRVSLNRFMEKRKSRIAGNAPYPSQHLSMGNHDKYTMMMGNMEQPEQKLELTLFK